MICPQKELPDLLRRIGTTDKDLRAIRRELLPDVRRCQRRAIWLMLCSGSPNARYMRRVRMGRYLAGLRWDGKPYRKTWVYRRGLSKDHAAYMRFWRKWKAK